MSETNQLWDDENETGNSSGLSLDQELEMALAEPSLDQELDAAFTESSSLDQELDAAFSEPAAANEFDSLDQELDAAFQEEPAIVNELDSLDQELDAAFQEEPAIVNELDSLDQELDAAFQEEPASAPADSLEDESFASDEPAFEAEVEEPAMVDVSEPVAIAPIAHDANDSFNLATLTQLVDEIRQESNRVSEMKASVARALSLIQEMSESLKS